MTIDDIAKTYGPTDLFTQGNKPGADTIQYTLTNQGNTRLKRGVPLEELREGRDYVVTRIPFKTAEHRPSRYLSWGTGYKKRK